ncbi:DUF6635 family protein [Marinagarivorans algicola]|uniref:DUF6635 family protein n=1 Tax=Marinagarivorans algicola TaxID=1513270 RepID=UPI0006B47057|nr:DUF6635 family protein [Marinagarivorans algicola]
MTESNNTFQDVTPALQAAINRGAQRYFEHCKKRIPSFTQQHFSYPGAWHTNKVAFGWDLIKMPVNLMWAPFFVLLQLTAFILGKCNQHAWRNRLLKIPNGFGTDVQKHSVNIINQHLLGNRQDPKKGELHQYIADELARTLQCNLHQGDNNKNNNHSSNNDTINTEAHNQRLHAQRQKIIQAIDPITTQALEQYAITRTASADITNTLISTIAGALAFKKFTPGGLGLGIIVAALSAKHQQTQTFILGSTLGGYYYEIFPPSPSAALIITCSFGVMCTLAVVASFSGLITDPIQYYTRLHHYRLRKLITHLERDFIQQNSSSFKPKDQYIARIMDIFDTLKTQF